MIELITGLPGNCKTLFTIGYVRNWAKADNREVFYSGIPLTEEGKDVLGWAEIQPEEWMKCPPNSIVVIDECQRVFRNRSINSQAPKYVTDLETHRHLGIDLVFITQHPMLIDPAVRRLTGRHRHMVRIFGMQASTVHEWPQVKENCDKPVYRKDSEKQKYVFDKSLYPLYKSAEVHTVKRRLPRRLLMLAAVPLVVALAVVTVRHLLLKPKSAQHQDPLPGAMVDAAGIPSPQKQEVLDPVADAKRFAFNNTPRVKGLEYTAPKYDELTKPAHVPVPAACVFNGKRCRCYSQQGTSLDVQFGECIAIVQNGYFESFDRDQRGGSEQAQSQRVQPPAPPVEASNDGPTVTTLGNGDGYGVLGARSHSASQSGGKS